MKYLLLSLFVFIATTILAQTLKVDTVWHQEWNGTGWQPLSRDISSYDGTCKLSSVLIQKWDNVSQIWVDSSLATNTYGSNDSIAQIITMMWIGGAWQNYSRKTNTYDAMQKLSIVSTDLWINNTWLPYLQRNYSYNASGFTDSIFAKKRLNGNLRNSTLTIFIYNADNTINTKDIKRWQQNISTWVNREIATYTYNADKTINQCISQVWFNDVWQNDTRLSYTYNALKVSTVLKEISQNGIWINRSLTMNTYDGMGNLTTVLNELWSDQGRWYNHLKDTLTYTDCALPLHLISFTASRNANIVSLKWETTNEINTSHFLIQRSLNGVDFIDAGNVTAKGNSSLTQYYSFTDNVDKLSGDKVYYRLQMIDKDGKFSYSKIIPLTLELYTGKIKAYPNPAKNLLFILFNMQDASNAVLRITDPSGKTVYSKQIITALSNNALSIDVSALSKGIYHVQVITDKDTQKTQFIKQ